MGMLLFALLLAAADPAPVEPRSARQSFEAARLQYDLGHFDAALALFESAYAAQPLPAFLFNMGQCHLQLGHPARAIYFYERFLEADPDAESAAVVRDLLAEARARAGEATPPAPTPATTTTLQPVPAPAPAAARARVEDEPTPSPWLWVAAAGGGAVVVAGVVVGAVLLSQPPLQSSLGVVDGRSP